MLAFDLIKGSFEESLLTIERLTGVNIGKRQAIAIAKQSAIDFDAFYQQPFLTARPNAVLNWPIIVLTTDGKGIVMRSDGLRFDLGW